MKKQNLFSVQSWRGYLLQLSIVIIGVMVTFIGSGLVARWSQARQVRSTMQLVVSELEENRHNVARLCERLLHDRAGMLLFSRHGFEVDSIPSDSLMHYNDIIGSAHLFKLRSDALEVFKSSGLISAVGDKQLLMEVMGCYNGLSAFGETAGMYNDRKFEAINHLFRGMNFSEQRSFAAEADVQASWRRVLSDPMCMGFLMSHSDFFGSEADFRRMLEGLDATIGSLKDKYKLQ